MGSKFIQWRLYFIRQIVSYGFVCQVNCLYCTQALYIQFCQLAHSAFFLFTRFKLYSCSRNSITMCIHTFAHVIYLWTIIGYICLAERKLILLLLEGFNWLFRWITTTNICLFLFDCRSNDSRYKNIRLSQLRPFKPSLLVFNNEPVHESLQRVVWPKNVSRAIQWYH